MNIVKDTTASFDIDPQNGFTPACPEELPVEGGNDIAPFLNQQALLARLRVVSKDAHPSQAIWKADKQNPMFSELSGDNVDIRWQMHCVPGTKGFELIAGLPAVTEYDYAVYKGIEPDMHPYGACYHDLHDKISTGVIEYFKHNGIKTVLCGGLATDYCVRLTVLQLLAAGFKVIVNLEACRGIAEGSVTQAVQEMKNKGAVVVNSASALQVI